MRTMLTETFTGNFAKTRQTVFAAAFICLSASVAPAASPVPYNWAGFYGGGNFGYGWGTAKDGVAFNDTIYPFASTRSHGDHMNGVLGGAQIGYNWQFSPNGVWGLEA